MALCTKEAGKTIPDGVAEVREAVDFLRYYAGQARTLIAPESLPSPPGETNTLQLAGRGVFACISPWNFPLADRKSVVQGKRVSVRVDLGGRRIIKTKKQRTHRQYYREISRETK